MLADLHDWVCGRCDTGTASRHALDKRAPCAHSYGLLFQCPSLWRSFKFWRVSKSPLAVFCWRHGCRLTPFLPPLLPVAVPPIHRNHPSRARRAARAEYPVNISRPRRRADFKIFQASQTDSCFCRFCKFDTDGFDCGNAALDPGVAAPAMPLHSTSTHATPHRAR